VDFKRIDVQQARQLLEQGATVVDVRDEPSFNQGHIKNATLIDNTNAADFIASADFDRPLLVYCYHGNMSQGAAAYFASNGFEETYSLDGGYEAWQEMSDSRE